MEGYAEFNKEVEAYLGWLELISPESLIAQIARFFNSPLERFFSPLYHRKDLSKEQQEAIISGLKIKGGQLENIVLPDDGSSQEECAEEIYRTLAHFYFSKKEM